MTYNPRQERNRQRRRRAAEAATGAPAMERALAELGVAFDDAAAINSFKMRVERLIRLGPGHPEIRARFGARAQSLRGRDLDAAVAAVERRWRDERKAFQIASVFGRGTRLSVEVLSELRLILRLARRLRMNAEYENAVNMLTEPPMALAAE